MNQDREIKIHLEPGAALPKRASEQAAGYDICSLTDYIIQPGTTCLVQTGIRLGLPPDLMAEVRSRSGLALHHSIVVLNSPGTIDPDYCGEIKIILHNFGKEPFKIEPGMRLAQLVFKNFFSCTFTLTDLDSETTPRGEGGFGHTGNS